MCPYKCPKLPISRFVQLSVVPPRSRIIKSGSLQERCNANIGPDSRSDNSKTARFLHKCAQNRQKGVICVRAESTIRTRQGAVSGPVDGLGRSRALRISTKRDLHGGVSSVRRTWISGVEISFGRFSRSSSRFREIEPLKQTASTANI